MKILNLDRRKGKTTELIKLSNKKWIYIICLDRKRAENISNMAMEMNIDIPFPITMEELPLRSNFIKEVLVDDMEDLLQCLVQKPILYATTSCEVVDEI
ncbi:MAG: hypothetical protein ACRCX8_11420 [Sarcina sp.]